MLKKCWSKDFRVMILDYSSEGLPIEFDEVTSEITYKGIKVPFFVVKEAIESGLDRVQLTEDLDLTIKNNFVTFGCLTLSETKVKQLIKLLWKQLQQSKQCNKVGKLKKKQN